MARAEAFAAEFGGAAHTDLTAMLGLPEVDILVIATPSGAHLEAAVAAALAGKHVLCEKPLDVTLERVDAMIAAHREAGTTLGCTFQIRYSPALEPLRAALHEGRFGRTRRRACTCRGGAPIRITTIVVARHAGLDGEAPC
jgi:predicted dehydrogenase